MEIAQTQRPAPYAPPPPRVEPVPPVGETAEAGRRPEAGADGERRERPTSEAPAPRRSDIVDRSFTLDPETNTLVFQALNAKGEVILQFPDQGLLRDRAYARRTGQDGMSPPTLDQQA